MGTWISGTKELVEKMAIALDDIEGDFSDAHLIEALEKLKEYPYTSNSIRSENKWRKYIDSY